MSRDYHYNGVGSGVDAVVGGDAAVGGYVGCCGVGDVGVGRVHVDSFGTGGGVSG